MYTVTSPDGLDVAFADTLSPGSAAKKVVEEGKLRAGKLIVRDETGARTVWEVSETRLVYAREVRE